MHHHDCRPMPLWDDVVSSWMWLMQQFYFSGIIVLVPSEASVIQDLQKQLLPGLCDYRLVQLVSRHHGHKITSVDYPLSPPTLLYHLTVCPLQRPLSGIIATHDSCCTQNLLSIMLAFLPHHGDRRPSGSASIKREGKGIYDSIATCSLPPPSSSLLRTTYLWPRWSGRAGGGSTRCTATNSG